MSNGPNARMNFAAWAAVIFALLMQLVTFAYGYGQQSTKLDTIDKRLERVERVLMDRSSRAEK